MSAHETASALEHVDAGTFERLAMAVLRRLYPKLASAAHLGINAQGKPIKGPWDGLHIHRGDPTVWSFVFHTTTRRQGLESKWLGVKGRNKGDVAVAAEEALKISREDPNAVVEIFLTSNQVLEEGLIRKVVTYCGSHGIRSVFFVGQDRLTDFLDVNPDGQTIRRRYLRLQHDRLSGTLLRSLCRVSAIKHAERFFLTSSTERVERELCQLLKGAIEHERLPAIILNGPSGFGKSDLAQSALRRHLRDGGYALWIPQEIADQEPLLRTAIVRMLKSLHPSLEADVYREVADLVVQSERPLLLVMDDANISSNPATLIEKVLSWASQLNFDDDSPFRATILLPVRPAIWNFVAERRDAQSKLRVLSIEKMSDEEAVHFATNRFKSLDGRIDAVAAAELATLCANDPLLISLLPPTDDIIEKARTGEPIWRYIRSVASRLEQTTPLICADILQTLDYLVSYVVANGTLRPGLATLRCWLPRPSFVGALDSLLKDRQLISFDAVDDTIVFRHDRIRDALLNKLFREKLIHRDPITYDPFWSQQVGTAIASLDESQIDHSAFSRKNPIALAYAYQLAASGPRADAVTASLRAALIAPAPELPSSATSEIAFVIARADLHTSLALTEGLDLGTFYLARFAQGDINAAVHFAAIHLGEYGLTYGDTVDWIRRGERHEPLRSAIQLALSDSALPDVSRIWLLRLAVYMRSPIPESIVAQAFALAVDKQAALAGTIGSLLRLTNLEAALSAPLGLLMAVPEKVKTPQGFIDSPRQHLAELAGSHIREISSAGLAALEAFAERGVEQCRILVNLLTRSTDSAAICL